MKKITKPLNRILVKTIAFCVFSFLLTHCSQRTTQSQSVTKGVYPMSISIISSAFNDGTIIPKKFTCDGENVSPELKWSSFPAKTKTFALIADDPDAPRGTWVHWVIFNIPASVNKLSENFPHDLVGAGGIKQGKNDSGGIGYDGPCPPSGTHRYFFKLYALDTDLALNAGCTKQELLDAMEGHILAQGQLMGRYHH